jgi:hypothetical protein
VNCGECSWLLDAFTERDAQVPDHCGRVTSACVDSSSIWNGFGTDSDLAHGLRRVDPQFSRAVPIVTGSRAMKVVLALGGDRRSLYRDHRGELRGRGVPRPHVRAFANSPVPGPIEVPTHIS